MKMTGALVSATALLALGSMPRLAEAQCDVSYGNHYLNEAQGTIEAETYYEELYIPGCPWAEAYQYGYFEHHYELYASIVSPTGRFYVGADNQVVPYGGGSASAWATLSYIGDPGEYVIDWIIHVICTVGGVLVDSLDGQVVDVLPGIVFVRLTFDDGPRVTSINRTYEVLAALAVNNAQTPILATFFVQTHAPTHGGHPTGLAALEAENAALHSLMIHTGSPGDHTSHRDRLADDPYDVTGDGMPDGATALDSDLIQAKALLAGIQGSAPKYVRAPEYDYDANVLATYAAHGLTHSTADVDSGDTFGSSTVESVKENLTNGLTSRVAQGDRDIVILLHDVHPITGNAANMREYIDHIKAVLQPLGYLPWFIRM